MTTCRTCAHTYAGGACPRCGTPALPESTPGVAATSSAFPAPSPAEAVDPELTVFRERLISPSVTASAPMPPAGGIPPMSTPLPAPKGPQAVPTQSGALGFEPVVGMGAPSIPPPTSPISAGRLFNALCYLATGVFLFIAGFGALNKYWYGPLIGLAFVAYGLKVLLTRSSYWVSWIIYLLPLAGLLFLYLTFSHR